MVHYPSAIRNIGPLKQVWSMRFESMYECVKSYLKNTNSRVNPCLSMTIKSGMKYSHFLMKHKKSFECLYEVNNFNTTNLKEKPYYKKLSEICINNLNTQSCKTAQMLTFEGIIYKSGYFLGIRSSLVINFF